MFKNELALRPAHEMTSRGSLREPIFFVIASDPPASWRAESEAISLNSLKNERLLPARDGRGVAPQWRDSSPCTLLVQGEQ